MTQPTKEQVLETLRQVVLPGGQGDPVSAGMISGIVVKTNNAGTSSNIGFTLEIDPTQAEAMETVRKACEAAVKVMPGVASCSAVMTAERAPGGGQAKGPPPSLGAKPQAQQGAAQKPLVPGVQSIIAVASGKGGVGKSTTSINLAMGLMAQGHKVGLLDADIYGPSMPRMAGISGRPTTEDGKSLRPMEAFGVKFMSMGFLVDEDSPMIWRGPMVQSALQQMLGDVTWGELDYLIVDMPPGTGDAQLTMAQRVPLAGSVIVSTPQDIALLDAKKAINMFRKVDVPIIGIVENMSYFICPHCQGRSDIFSHGGARDCASQFGVDFLAEIPLDLVIRETSDGGKPIVVSSPSSPQAKAYLDMSEAVHDRIQIMRGGAKAFPTITYS